MTLLGTYVEHRRFYIQNVVYLARVNKAAELVPQCDHMKIGS